MPNDFFAQQIHKLALILFRKLNLAKEGSSHVATEDFIGYRLPSHPTFKNLRLPPELRLIFAKRLAIRAEEMDLLYHFLTQEMKSSAQIGLLVLFGEDDDLQQTRCLLRDKMQSVYAYDIVLINRQDIQQILVSKAPHQILRRIILAQADLRLFSPFIEQGPTADEMFFGREWELRELTQQSATTSYALIGGRRIGKTSILKRLHNINLPRAGLYTLYYDCSFSSTYEEFLTTPIRDWKPKRLPNAPINFKKLLNTPFTDKPLVLLFDEADKLVAMDRTNGWSFLNKLRALANSDQLQVVFSGERVLRDALRDSSTPLFNFCKEMPIGCLEFSAVEELVMAPMKQLGIEFIEENLVVEHIWAFTSGHPNVVQRLCNRLIERLNEHRTRQITVDDVEAIIQNVDFVRKDFLATYFSRASVLEHLCALLMTADENLRTLAAIHQTLCNQQLEVTLNQVDNALERLVTRRRILKHSTEGYDFAITAFPRLISQMQRLHDLIALRKAIYKQAGDIDPEAAPRQLRGRLW